jgi:hypothetical protein
MVYWAAVYHQLTGQVAGVAVVEKVRQEVRCAEFRCWFCRR